MYESPMITELGTVADFTRAAGWGPGSDSSFPFIQEHFPRFNDLITHATS